MEKQRKTGRFPGEVRERAVRLVRESESSHPSRWAALVSVSGKIGCTAETLRRWVHEAEARGRKSLRPGRYFRMLLVGYFEGIACRSKAIRLCRSRRQETAEANSERGIEWRCADSLSLREFLLLESRERAADHSWLSPTRSSLPLEVHDEVFAWVLQRLAEHGLVKGERIGVDASTMKGPEAFHPTCETTQVRRPARGSE